MNNRSGQAIIESCVVVGIICLFLMGLFQLSQLFMAREIMNYAAGRGARAHTVGLNSFMVDKVVDVATIAAAGLLLDRPDHITNAISQRAYERGRIPLYLAAEYYGRLSSILDYADWDTISHSALEDGNGLLNFRVQQKYPIRSPIFKAFYSDDNIVINGAVTIENHYPLYLQDY